MSPTVVGLFTGLILGLATAFTGFSGFLYVVVFGAIGFVVGKVLTGDIDVSSYLGQGSSSRRSR